jgi:hypothetical protein
VSNYFGQSLASTVVEASLGEKAVVFSDRDTDFRHIYFVAGDSAELRRLMTDLPREPMVLDYLAKTPDQEFLSLFESVGFRLRASYRHLSGVMPKALATKTQTAFAREEEAPELRARMPRDLDRFCDHFPGTDELRQMIVNKQVLVYRIEGRIAGYFVYKITGVRCHLNYWATEAQVDPSCSIDLLLRCYAELAGKGVKYVYAWVDSKNTKVLKIHERCGLRFDGLNDLIYERDVHEKRA